MTFPSIGRALSIGTVVLVIACAPSEEGGVEMAMPDTTAASLWAYLEQVDYQNSWQLWPAKGRLYAGNEPHGMLLTTYVNQAAHDAITGMSGSMPGGAIIVKENYMPDSAFAAATVMYKVDGYNAEHNDWFWLKRLADGTVEVVGRGQGCQNCHLARRDNDYLYTSALGN